MATTKRDDNLKKRIIYLIKQLQGKEDKEIIYMIAGVCGVSTRTATEHFKSYKAQQTLKELGFEESCVHEWSNAYSTAGGLVKECINCGVTKNINLN